MPILNFVLFVSRQEWRKKGQFLKPSEDACFKRRVIDQIGPGVQRLIIFKYVFNVCHT